MSAKDTAKTTDAVSVDVVGASSSVAVSSYSACPKCAKAMKQDHDGGLICSNRQCRHKLAATERKTATVVSIAPTDPCPKCGKASKIHHNGGRICSDKTCRHEFSPQKS